MADTEMIKDRQGILIPATFGVHSMIQNELRDYIARAFGHSTFSFHEVFLDRPVMWFQGFNDLLSNSAYGTTQPFLSRFVYQSGLTPAVDPGIIQKLRNDRIQRKKIKPLQLPLVATDKDSYHRGLENLKFPLAHSIFLRGLLEIWSKSENDQIFKSNQWRTIDNWNQVFDPKSMSPIIGGIDPSPGSNRNISVIGRLNGRGIRRLYEEAVIQEIDNANDSLWQVEALASEAKVSAQSAVEARLRKSKAAQAGPDKAVIPLLGDFETGKTNAEDTVSKLVEHYRAAEIAATEAALALLREYHVALRPWIDVDTSPVVIAASICSDALFWGECVLILPGNNDGRSASDLSQSYRDLLDILVRKIQGTFMPIMTIFENYVLEGEVNKRWDDWQKSANPLPIPNRFLGFDKRWMTQKENIAALKNVGMGHDPKDFKGTPDTEGDSDHIFLSLLCECIANTKWKNKLNELERSLISLWAARFSFAFDDLPEKGDGIESFVNRMRSFEDSLVFQKYLVASPAILKAIISAMTLRHGERSEGKPSVKTALVIGGPGSGKDSMAKLVRLFSPGYRLGPLIVLNMASFRPKEAAVPLLIGLNIWDEVAGQEKSKKQDRIQWSIASLLGRAWKEHSDVKWKPKSQEGKGLSFIFDELNSLDLDTQGALLRFLESGELLSLGDYKDPTREVDALIIGVMNEDPDTITKVRTIDRIVRDKQVFGGLLGDFLYEFFRGQRRLRDDLYFRMARGGEIVMPDLRQRREDIPILFYLIVRNELLPTVQVEKDNLDIELSTYELLMSSSFQWEGNVRELQALAREIFTVAMEDHRNQQKRETSKSDRLIVRGTHVRTAKDNLTRRTQPIAEKLVQSS
jgi:hypothetical protein